MELDLGAEEKERALSTEELLLAAYRGSAPTALVEKLWSYGRYLLISSSRATGNPCPLLGLWHGDYRAFWSFIMLNENLQMCYWQAFSGNMPELMAHFDVSRPDMANSKRTSTVVPQQALFLMNSPMSVDVVRRIVNRPGSSPVAGSAD